MVELNNLQACLTYNYINHSVAVSFERNECRDSNTVSIFFNVTVMGYENKDKLFNIPNIFIISEAKS